MSESLTIIVAGLMVAFALLVVFWTALTLVKTQKTREDHTLYICFSVSLAALLGIAFLLPRSFYSDYLLALFMLLSWAGSLLLLVLGVVISIGRRRERQVGTVIAACLSGALFIGFCVTVLR